MHALFRAHEPRVSSRPMPETKIEAVPTYASRGSVKCSLSLGEREGGLETTDFGVVNRSTTQTKCSLK